MGFRARRHGSTSLARTLLAIGFEGAAEDREPCMGFEYKGSSQKNLLSLKGRI